MKFPVSITCDLDTSSLLSAVIAHVPVYCKSVVYCVDMYALCVYIYIFVNVNVVARCFSTNLFTFGSEHNTDRALQ